MADRQPEDRSYFFDEGLNFACQACDACCTGDPGIVQLTVEEAQKIAHLIKKNLDEMIGDELIVYKEGYRLYEDTENGACVFLTDGACRIYKLRPLQCKTWPFWIENLRSPKAWRKAAKECPGIGKGRLYTRDEILEILHSF